MTAPINDPETQQAELREHLIERHHIGYIGVEPPTGAWKLDELNNIHASKHQDGQPHRDHAEPAALHIGLPS